MEGVRVRGAKSQDLGNAVGVGRKARIKESGCSRCCKSQEEREGQLLWACGRSVLLSHL